MAQYLYYLELYTEKLIQDNICKKITLVNSSVCVGIYHCLENAVSSANEEQDKSETILYKYIYKIPIGTKINDKYVIKDEYFVMSSE